MQSDCTVGCNTGTKFRASKLDLANPVHISTDLIYLRVINTEIMKIIYNHPSIP
jgi:hypothetical protein